MKRPLVIGLGHRYRSDDGVGPRVVDELRSLYPVLAEYRESQGDAAELLDLFEGREAVILIDAVCKAEDEAGKIYRLDGLNDSLPVQDGISSSHVLSLSEALQLGRILDRLPGTLVIYGINGANFDPGDQLSGPVAGCTREVIEAVVARLNQMFRR